MTDSMFDFVFSSVKQKAEEELCNTFESNDSSVNITRHGEHITFQLVSPFGEYIIIKKVLIRDIQLAMNGEKNSGEGLTEIDEPL